MYACSSLATVGSKGYVGGSRLFMVLWCLTPLNITHILHGYWSSTNRRICSIVTVSVKELWIWIKIKAFVVWFWCCSGTGKWFRIEKETSCLPVLNAGVRNLEVWNTKSPTDWMPTHKQTEQKNELSSPSLWWVSIQSPWLHYRNWFTPGPGDIHVEKCGSGNWSPSSNLFQVLICWESPSPSRHKTTVDDVESYFKALIMRQIFRCQDVVMKCLNICGFHY